MISIVKLIYDKLFPKWKYYLRKELIGCNTILDVGCGKNSQIQYLNVYYSVGVDIFEPYLQESKEKKIHNKYIKTDITRIKFKSNSFDAVLCTEVIEHLTKEEGTELIKKMKKWARKKVIITTPNGYKLQGTTHNNIFQKHKCGWNTKELRKLGFKVYGRRGWKGFKNIKGNDGMIKYKPILLWIILLDLTEKITHNYPNQACNLLAISKTKCR